MIRSVESAGDPAVTPASVLREDPASAAVFAQIACLALSARAVLSEANQSSESGWLELAAQSLVCQIGYLADLGSKRLSGSVMHGGADQWLLPPSFHAASTGGDHE